MNKSEHSSSKISNNKRAAAAGAKKTAAAGGAAAAGAAARQTPREAALLALDAMERSAAYSSTAIKRSITRGQKSRAPDSGDYDSFGGYEGFGGFEGLDNLDIRDNALLRELVYGATKWKLTLDSIIIKYSKIKKHKIDPIILTILRLGAYQILFLDKIPVSAACNESVKLAKKYGNEGSVRYVNAILRKIAACKPSSSSAPMIASLPVDGPKQSADYLSARYSYPIWICERWLDRYGYDNAAAMMDAGNLRPELSIRANTLRISPDALKAKIEAKGYIVATGLYTNKAFIIKNPSGFSESEEFLQGLYTVQDESSMLAVEALHPSPGDNILDLCAAPGGKCGYIAEMTDNGAVILAADIRPHRLMLMEHNIARLGHNSIILRLMDSLFFQHDLEHTMDKVLLDAPCTGLGVIRRKPEIKWRRDQSDVATVARIQKTLLSNAARYLKPGGVLLYSVCTTEPDECEDIIQQFLQDEDGFKPDDLSKFLPSTLWTGMPQQKGAENSSQPAFPRSGSQMAGLYLYPHIHKTDGFYMARLIKI